MRWLTGALALFAGACGPYGTLLDDSDVDETVELAIENESGFDLWHFRYAACGSDSWSAVIASDEFTPNGATVSSGSLTPGCYDLYVEDERGCSATHDTGGNVEAGLRFTWTILVDTLAC